MRADGWMEARLMDVVRPDAPIGYGIVQPGPFVRGGVSVIAIRDLPNPSVRTTHRSAPSTEAAYRRSRVTSGDILISVKGTTGRIGIVPGGFSGNISRDVARTRLKGDQEPEFWLQMLRSSDAQRTLGLAAVGTTRQELSIGTLKTLSFWFPPQEEQRQIAAVLADADRLIEKLAALVAKKQAIRNGMAQQLLAGQRRLAGFDDDWSETTLGDVAHIKTGSRNNQDKVPLGRYPFFVRSATVERIDSYSFDCEAILVPGEGGIGTIFHYVNGKFDAHQRVYKISDFKASAVGKYVYHYMRQFFGSHAMKNTVRATVDSLRLPAFKAFSLRLPEPDEQLAIVQALDDAYAEIDLLERRLEKTRAMKDGMAQQLLTGQVRLPALEAVA
jgi:type I restriction enzyme, S subunit